MDMRELLQVKSNVANTNWNYSKVHERHSSRLRHYLNRWINYTAHRTGIEPEVNQLITKITLTTEYIVGVVVYTVLHIYYMCCNIFCSALLFSSQNISAKFQVL